MQQRQHQSQQAHTHRQPDKGVGERGRGRAPSAAALSPGAVRAANLLALQRTTGNRTATRWLNATRGREAAALVQRQPPAPTPDQQPAPSAGRQVALVSAAQSTVDVVGNDLKRTVSGEETGGQIIADIIKSSILSVTVAGALLRLGVAAGSAAEKVAKASLTAVANEAADGIAGKLAGRDSVDVSSFVEDWKAEQKWAFANRFHDIWHNQGGTRTDLEEALANTPRGSLAQVRHQLLRGVLGAYMEAARRSKGFWDPGGLGLLHLRLPTPNDGTVDCSFIGFSGDIVQANRAFKKTGVDPLRIGERGVRVLLTVDLSGLKPEPRLRDLFLPSYSSENWWLLPAGVRGGKGGWMFSSKFAQLSTRPANWEAPQVAVTSAGQRSFEVGGGLAPYLTAWGLAYRLKLPIPASFGQGVPVKGWHDVSF